MIESGLLILAENGDSDLFYGQLLQVDNGNFSSVTENNLHETLTFSDLRVYKRKPYIETELCYFNDIILKDTDTIAINRYVISGGTLFESVKYLFRNDSIVAKYYNQDYIQDFEVPMPPVDGQSVKYKYVTYTNVEALPFRPMNAQSADQLFKYQNGINYTNNFILNGIPGINYDITGGTLSGQETWGPIPGGGSEKDRKGLIRVRLDGIDIQEAINNEWYYIDYGLTIDGNTIHSHGNGYDNVALQGIVYTNGGNFFEVLLDVETFNLKTELNNPKTSMSYSLILSIRQKNTGAIVDVVTYGGAFNLTNYGTNRARFTKFGSLYSGYVDTNVLGIQFNHNNNTYAEVRVNAGYSTGTLVRSYGSGNSPIYTQNLETLINDYRGKKVQIMTNIWSPVNSWFILNDSDSISYINTMSYDIKSVNLTIDGQDATSAPVTYDYIESDSGSDEPKNDLSSVKFFSNGSVVARAEFDIEASKSYLFGNSGGEFMQEPNNVYFIAVKKPSDYTTTNYWYFNAKQTSVKDQRGVSELPKFSNVSSSYGGGFINLLPTTENVLENGIIYKKITVTTPPNLPNTIGTKSYNMTLDLTENGDYIFYVIIQNDIAGYTSHCISNTDRPDQYYTYFDIPWRQ